MTAAKTRRVWFTMVCHPVRGWIRVGRAFDSSAVARSWLPVVRGFWRGLRTRVSPLTLRWKNGRMTDETKKILSGKFNLDPPKEEQSV